MKSKEEIEQLSESYLQKNKYNFDNWKEIEHVKRTYIDTYTQCQEDMSKILFNILKLVNESEYTEYSRLTDIKDYINSLNKQD